MVSVDFALSIVSGIIKLGGRIDKIRAENFAGNTPLALPDLPTGNFFNTQRKLNAVRAFKDKLLADGSSPDNKALGLKIKQFLDTSLDADDFADQLDTFIAANPDVKATVDVARADFDRTSISETDKDKLKALAVKHGLDPSDEDISRALYLVAAGKSRQKSPEWRIAMATLDVLGEFALENQKSLIKNDDTRKIVGSILERFTDGDLEDTVLGPKMLFERTLSAGLNSMLDNRDLWQGDNKWVKGAVNALYDARASMDEADQDDYLVGLVSGKGYKQLVGELLEEGANLLDDGDTVSYKDVLAGLLQETATVYKGSQTSSFKEFVRNHWADIARAGLRSFADNGPALMANSSAILRTTLVAAANTLGNSTGKFTEDTIIAAAEAAIAAAAADPTIMDGDNPRIQAVFKSFADTVASAGLQKTFTEKGLDTFARNTLRAVASNPTLISNNPSFGRDLLGSILGNLADADGFNAEGIASAAVSGALAALANRPDIITKKYADTLGSFAARLSGLVKTHKLSGIQAEQLTTLAAQTIADVAERVREDGGPSTPSWLKAAFLAFADVVAEDGLPGSLSAAGLEGMVRSMLETISKHPEMVIRGKENAAAFLSGITAKIAAVENFNGDAIATAALDGALTVVSEKPDLITGKYPAIVGDMAASLATEVRSATITGLQADMLIRSATAALAANPDFLVEKKDQLAGAIVKMVIGKGTPKTSVILAGTGLVQITSSLLTILAARGKFLIGSGSVDDLVTRIGNMLSRALDEAADQLGARVDVPSAADAVQALMEAWSRGEVSEDMLEEEPFQKLFAEIADKIQKRKEMNLVSAVA